MVGFRILNDSKAKPPRSLRYVSYLLLLEKNFRRKAGKQVILFGKYILKGKQPWSSTTSAGPSRVGKQGQPGTPQNVTRSPATTAAGRAAAVRGRARPAGAPRSGHPKLGVPRSPRDRVKTSGPTPFPGGNRWHPREPPAARLPSPTPTLQAHRAKPPSGRCYHTPARRLASRPQLGCAGGAAGRADQEPSEKRGWRKGPL